MKQPERILLIRIKSMGDVLFTLPATQMIRDNFPQATLHFLTDESLAPLVALFPVVQEVLPLKRGLFKHQRPWRALLPMLSLARRLRRNGYQLVVDFQGYGETALMAWLTGSAARWAGSTKKARRKLFSDCWPVDPGQHPIDAHRDLLRQGGLQLTSVTNQLRVTNGHLDEARHWLRGYGWRPDRPQIFIQPFSSNPQKNWPLERFVALARRCRQKGFQILFGGGQAERSRLVSVIGQEFPVAAGLDLITSAALIQLSSLVVGGDTGLLHLGVALRKRVVMIIRCDFAGMTIPYGHPEWTVEAPPGKYVTDITVEAVEAAIERCGERGAEA